MPSWLWTLRTKNGKIIVSLTLLLALAFYWRVVVSQAEAAAADPSVTSLREDANNRTGGGLFYCGYVMTTQGRSILPDYAQRYEGGYDHKTQYQHFADATTARAPAPEDILIWGMHGPCDKKVQDFPGKVLVLNGEPYGGDWTMKLNKTDIYQLGSVVEGPRTMRNYFVAWGIFLVHYLTIDASILPKLSNLPDKPLNTGKYHALIYTQSNCVDQREEAVNEISTILPIHLGGRCGGARPHEGTFQNVPLELHRPRKKGFQNYELYKDYKFCLAMENSNQVGYISEKILNAFLAGCVPIYWGNREDVVDVFNPQAFVYYDVENPALALEQIRLLSTNQTAYQAMLHHQPILANGTETLRKHFSWVEEIEGGYLKHKVRAMMGV